MSKRSTTIGPRDPAEITALAIERRLSRRGFLMGSGAGLGAIALAGCAPPAASAPASSAAASAPAASGDASPSAAASADLGTELKLATWPLYHDPAVLDAFTAATGVAIDIQVYGSTEEMEARSGPATSGIDMVVPSQVRDRGLDHGRPHRAARLQPKLPDVDLADWNPLFVDQDFDPGNAYTIPKNWGTTGIAFWADEVSPDVTSWADFFRWPARTLQGKTFQIVDHQISLDGLGGGGHGLCPQHRRRDRAGRGRGHAHRPQAEAVRHQLGRRAAAAQRRTHWRPSRGPATASRWSATTPSRAVHRGQRRRRAVGGLVGHRRGRAAQGCGVRVPRLHPPAREQRRGHGVLRCSRTPTRRPGAAAAGGQRQPGHLPARGVCSRR